MRKQTIRDQILAEFGINHSGRNHAVYASNPDVSRGRMIFEPPSIDRTPFQRDRDRIIHSSAFRRLKQKTQVFVAHEGDNYRTRLTHSLEVAQIARSLARNLACDEDLAEGLALAHDLGHPPFGHAGEDALNVCMAKFEGFDHNAQTLRVVTHLEQKYPEFDGLNLCWEMLEGLVKHNGPVICKGISRADLPAAFLAYAHIDTLELSSHAGIEAQLAALADDIAYNNHDIDDGLSAGLFRVEDMKEIPLVGETFAEVRARYPDIELSRQITESIRRLIGHWITDLTHETFKQIESISPQSSNDIRTAGRPIAQFSDQLNTAQSHLREFLSAHMYHHYSVNRKMSIARRIVQDLFGVFHREPNTLPPPWQPLADPDNPLTRARVVCDYIAGMTDSFAISEHRRLFHIDL